MNASMVEVTGASRFRNRARGFTLIELMIVVAVVAVLAAIAIPSYQDQVRKSRRGQAKADLVELAQRAERFHTVNNSYAGFWATVEAVDHDVSPRTGTAYYALDRVGGDTAVNDFVFAAVPQNGQEKDTRCMTLILTNTGKKDIDGGTAGSASDCW